MKYRKKPIVIEAFLLGGRSRADYGKDYIIRGVRGELYPCEKEIFEETYEKVED